MIHHFKNNLLFIFIWFVCHPAFSQLTDSFSDGNLHSNPNWIGDHAKFIVNPAFQLQSDNAAITGQIYISTAALTSDSTVWECYFKLGFNPSSNNNLRIYLKSDNSDLMSNLTGYYIQIGENGGADGIDLFREDGSSSVKIIDGTAGTVSLNPEVRIRIIRMTNGDWEIWADLTGGNNYILQGSGNDITYNLGLNFGIVCKHTSSNASNFIIDDILIDPLYIDTDAPEILWAKSLSVNTAEIKFNEPVTGQTGGNTNNYFLEPGLGAPSIAIRDVVDSSLIILEWSGNFINGNSYTLKVSGISDYSTNSIQLDSVGFDYYLAERSDIVINEIMADPTPQTGLPEAEYIELYNTKPFNITLDNWKFSDATSTVSLPEFVLPSNGYVILCDINDTFLFVGLGAVQGAVGFPSLNNSSDQLTLTDSSGVLISEVDYTDSWYRDGNKKNGGWSLESIDPVSSCLNSSNWIASIDPNGGTPGKVNSVIGMFVDTVNPKFLQISILSPNQLLITFNESIDTGSALNHNNYQIDNGLNSPAQVFTVPGNPEQIRLTLSSSIVPDILYTLIVSNVSDCHGNINSNGESGSFIIPVPMGKRDLLINEILFNPLSGGVDYVEIFNHSEHIFNLKGLKIIETEPFSGLNIDESVIGFDYIMRPSEYVVFSSDRIQTMFGYFVREPSWLLEVKDLPNWPDNEGGISIFQDTTEIDALIYNADWQYGLLKEDDGVSLERITFENRTQDPSNWFSASSTIGFGTPTYKNSQFNSQEPFEAEIELDPETFSPDNDGYNDVLLIQYRFSGVGYTAKVQIFDAKGRMVRSLINNELLGQTGLFKWDGIFDDGMKGSIGIYIVYFEVFDLNGNVKVYKKRCVLAGRI